MSDLLIEFTNLLFLSFLLVPHGIQHIICTVFRHLATRHLLLQFSIQLRKNGKYK